MRQWPFSKTLLDKGRFFLQEGFVKLILFSEGTYQVEVEDPKEEVIYWPFLQLDDAGEISDHFCTCKEAEATGSCPHLAAAFLEIYRGRSSPLHIRFRDSLWNRLMQLASKRHGYDAACLKQTKEGEYYAQSLNRKRLFTIHPLTKKGERVLHEMLYERVLETEETSLKFSNLSLEEIALWREGRPSHHLQYELSFWSDLAKWMMLLSENKQKYKLIFHPQKGALPKAIEILFKDVKWSIYIAAVNWSEILIPLAMMQCPISIYEYQEMQFEKITYDARNKVLQLHTHALEGVDSIFFARDDDVQTSDLGEWKFHPEVGFYIREVDPLLREKRISVRQISTMLSRHGKLLEKYLVDTTIDLGLWTVSYDLYFDEQQNFHIDGYLFEKGDLQKEDSYQFGNWVFVQGQGFYEIKGLLFNQINKVVPKHELSRFITKHKLWLNHYEGFQTHLMHIECYLVYEVDRYGTLVFKNRAQNFEEASGIIDLEEWLYIEGRGFYAKASIKTPQVVRPGLTVIKEDVSSFIKSHEDELEMLQGFFSLKTPIEKSGLEITLNQNLQIIVKPKFCFSRGYDASRVRFFGEYVYVTQEGFSLLPKGGQIPEIYHLEKIIPSEQEESFIMNQLPLLKPMILYLDHRLKQPKQLVLKINTIEQAQMMWDVDAVYVSEYGEVPIKDLWENIRKGVRVLKTHAGLMHLEDTRFSWLRNLKHHSLHEGRFEINALDWMRLVLVEKIQPPSADDERAETTLKILNDMQSLQTSDILSLEGLQSSLRPYQEKGVQWLWFLYSYGLSGLLCDEMGLGKTHQAMALLAACKNRNNVCKFLVVCPTSVIYHWEELLKKFLPHIKVLVFYGTQRSLAEVDGGAELVLTSYGVARSEKEALMEIAFDVAIFDELQVAKNTCSQIHKALKMVNARMKLGLTGTPIENRLLELHALFDIVLPDYLPAELVSGDKESLDRLAKIIHPFVLRRKKEEVLQDLPEKTEEIAYIDLSQEQKELYAHMCQRHRDIILKEMQQDQEKVPYIHIFALFNILKQICNHPALVNKDIEHYDKYTSGKWDLFIELLHEARESGQKVVVFSQYLQMLDIMEMYLKRHHIGYAQIRGSTKWRKEELRRFREDPSCEVFIGSLQAAGVGIELVSASVVIHYDRWWNPAKENQATDRVHRLGQNRGVQVFKLVSKDTIEEHIHWLIEQKTRLFQDVVMYDDQDQIKRLDRFELLDLLKKIDSKLNFN